MAKMLLKALKYMNAKDALAAIKDMEKLRDKGRNEDDHRGRKRERPIVRLVMGVKRKMKNSSNSKIHSFSYAC